MSKTDSFREEVKRVLLTAPNRYCEITKNDKWVSYYEIPDPEKFLDAICELHERKEDDARIAEHKWYEENEVYQIYGHPILSQPTARVVKIKDIKNRIRELNRKE